MRLLVLLIFCALLVTLAGCSRKPCSQRPDCLDINIVIPISLGNDVALEIDLNEIDENLSRKSKIQSATLSCSPPGCQLNLEIGSSEVRLHRRYTVSASATSLNGRRYSAVEEQFVLTYGSPSHSTVVISGQDEAQKQVRQSASTITNAIYGDLLGVEVREISGRSLNVDAYVKDKKLIAIKEIYQAPGDTTRYRYYIVVEGKLATVLDGLSPDPNMATSRVEFFEVSATRSAEQLELASKFDDLKVAVETTAATAKTVGAANSKRGAYIYAGGLNTLTDCETGDTWWVTASPPLMAQLTDIYHKKRSKAGMPIGLTYSGAFHQGQRLVGNGMQLKGDVRLETFSVENNLPASGESKSICENPKIR